MPRGIPSAYCIGCGLCVASCPHGALRMRKRFDSRFEPVVDVKACAGCAVCVSVCPQESDRLLSLAESVSGAPDPSCAGLTDAKFFLAWDEHDSYGRRKSSSGGVVTALALRLLAEGDIDGVVHVRPVFRGRGGAHFEATLSRTAKEISACRGSAYETLDFSETFAALERGKRYLVVGTPCLARGAKLLSKTPRFKEVGLVTCALVCSHNVTPQLADYLADRHHIPENSLFGVNLRDKEGIVNASKFNTRYFDADGRDFLRMERTESGWTDIWRSYAFAPKACCYCPDFWGGEADVSVKDAWGRKEWKHDPLGKSVVIVRDRRLVKTLASSGLAMEALDIGDVAYTQPGETVFKQASAAEKFRCGLFSPCNVRNGLLRRRLVSSVTRRLYAILGDVFVYVWERRSRHRDADMSFCCRQAAVRKTLDVDEGRLGGVCASGREP